ncbi:MAG TPA: hypothetical protein DHV55_13995 [Clostridiaceae bacterium]|nr:hypothetical protein [Clostridiaceae bacterium]
MKSVKSLSRVVIENLIFFIVLVVLSFLLPRLIPGSPIYGLADNTHVLNMSVPEEVLSRYKEYYAPEKTLAEQFILNVEQLLKGNLGYSFHFGLPVSDIIKGRIGWTLLLSISAILISTMIAVSMGIKAAMKKGSFMDKLLVFLVILMEAVPIFLFGLLIQMAFAYKLRLFPAQGAYSIGMDHETPGFFMDALKHSVLPLMALTFSQTPSFLLLVRNTAIRVKKEPYVEMAVYNDIDEKTIKYKYIVKNCLPELIGKLNIHIIYAIVGTLFIEVIFSYPGMGELMKIAAGARDYCLIQGIFLLTGLYGIAVNIILGFLTNIIFPRMRA